MLLVAINPTAGQEHAAQAPSQPSSSSPTAPPPPPIQTPTPPSIPTPTSPPIPTPTSSQPIPTPPPISTPPPIPTPTPPPIPTPTPPPTSPPPPPPETEPTTDEYIYEEQSPVHPHFSPSQEQAPSHMPMDDLLQAVPKLISRVDSLEMDLKQTKLTMGNAIVKLVKKVKKLEGFLKRRNLVLTDSEDEEPEAQGRKSQDDPQDSSIQGLVTPPTTKVHASGEEQVEDISPNTLEAAKTLSKVASLKSRSIDKGRRYKRRKETKSKKVVSSLDFQEDDAGEINAAGEEVNTASEVNTGSIKLNTVIEQDSTVGSWGSEVVCLVTFNCGDVWIGLGVMCGLLWGGGDCGGLVWWVRGLYVVVGCDLLLGVFDQVEGCGRGGIDVVRKILLARGGLLLWGEVGGGFGLLGRIMEGVCLCVGGKGVEAAWLAILWKVFVTMVFCVVCGVFDWGMNMGFGEWGLVLVAEPGGLVYRLGSIVEVSRLDGIVGFLGGGYGVVILFVGGGGWVEFWRVLCSSGDKVGLGSGWLSVVSCVWPAARGGVGWPSGGVKFVTACGDGTGVDIVYIDLVVVVVSGGVMLSLSDGRRWYLLCCVLCKGWGRVSNELLGEREIQWRRFAKEECVDFVKSKKEVNQGTWKITQLKKLNFEEVKEEYRVVMELLFVESNTGTETPINPVLVAMKTPSVATYKIIKQGEKGVYQIVREDGTDIVYINFGAMLEIISMRWDHFVLTLYRIRYMEIECDVGWMELLEIS
ncbi:hypothetical protein Tco_1272873 [Tanacetum coccineum]